MTAYLANAITVFGSWFGAMVIANYSPGKRGPEGLMGPTGWPGPKGDAGESGGVQYVFNVDNVDEAIRHIDPPLYGGGFTYPGSGR